MGLDFFLEKLEQGILADLHRVRGYGCVTFDSQGSHRDMDAQTFLASSQAIRRALSEIQEKDRTDFQSLRRFGQSVEQAMFKASHGVNTYRGLIFLVLFLLEAYLHEPVGGRFLPEKAENDEDKKIIAHIQNFAQPLEADYWAPESFRTARLHAQGIRDIRQIPLTGFADLFRIRQESQSWSAFTEKEFNDRLTLTILSQFDDTTTLHRSDLATLRRVQTWARKVAEDYSPQKAEELNHYCLERNLSTGGTADLFICSLLIRELF